MCTMKIHNCSEIHSSILHDQNSLSTLKIKYGRFNTQNNPLFMVVIYSFMGVFGLLGNIITCIVITSNKSMHTATNCYLFNLAISDLMILLWAFPPLNSYINYTSELLCIIRGWLAESSVYASVLTITVFSVERYIAICHPFLTQTLSKLSRAAITIPIIWFVALLCALPLTLQLGLVHHVGDNSLVMCTITNVIVPYSLELSSLMFFGIPMFFICAMYVAIGLRIREKGWMPKNDCSMRNENGNGQIDRCNKKVLKMLVAVVAAFFISWAPFHLQRIIPKHMKFNKNAAELHSILSFISGILYYSSAIINPILYNIMSNKFRQASKVTLMKFCKAFHSIYTRIKLNNESIGENKTSIDSST